MKTRHAALTCSLLALAALAGCRKISGTYSATQGPVTVSINFKSSDKADISIKLPDGSTTTKEISYKVDGDKITLSGGLGVGGDKEVTFTKNSDGTLTAPDGMKLTKQ